MTKPKGVFKKRRNVGVPKPNLSMSENTQNNWFVCRPGPRSQTNENTASVMCALDKLRVQRSERMVSNLLNIQTTSRECQKKVEEAFQDDEDIDQLSSGAGMH
ncbi:hypothetical protein J6590_007528 [Homalodisca vitripennis]|nr:hypothetical protein J6590_007528 [Homalodisca vitripennis]